MKFRKKILYAVIIIFVFCSSLVSVKLPYPTSSSVPDQILDTPHTVTLSVVGDLMVHAEQLEHALTMGKGDGDYNFDYCFSEITAYLSKSDYTIGNLETTFAGESAGYKTYPLFNTPDSFAQALKSAGFDFVTTANNHCNDMGESGLFRTLDVLDSIGLDHAGTYHSQAARDQIFIKEVNTIRFALLSYTFSTNGIPVATPYTVNMLTDIVKSDIVRAKESADFVILYAHMGVEYAPAPAQDIKNWVRDAVEWGADIVLLSHPHVLQAMEFITVTNNSGVHREGFVIYSLGNFTSHQRTPPRDAGIILNVELTKNANSPARIQKISYIPTWVMFTDNTGAYDIKVWSVYDALTEYQRSPQTSRLSERDISRLYAVHDEILALYPDDSKTGQRPMQREYLFYQHS